MRVRRQQGKSAKRMRMHPIGERLAESEGRTLLLFLIDLMCLSHIDHAPAGRVLSWLPPSGGSGSCSFDLSIHPRAIAGDPRKGGRIYCHKPAC